MIDPIDAVKAVLGFPPVVQPVEEAREMTPVERLEAAIDKLETLKVESTGGAWFAHENIIGNVRVRVSDMIVSEVYGGDKEEEATSNADLIVTLHRTIDAQLAILRDALNLFRDSIPLFRGHEERICAAHLALADALLGVDNADR